jgi:DNA mismatch repair protein MutS2
MIIRAKNVPGAGIIKSIDREKRKVTVVYKDVEFSVDVEDIQEIEATEKVSNNLYNESKIKRLFQKNVSEVIDLHGYRVEEALNIVDKYLDDAILSGHNEVKIIHGFGQGKLREALIEFLKTHKQVKEFRPANVLRGGEGTMIVTLI